MFSILFRSPSIPAPILTLIGALASVRTLQDLGAPVSLKWPNDIVAVESCTSANEEWEAPERKLGGVLCESRTGDQGSPRLILGIGLNINMNPGDFPEALRDRSTSLAILSGVSWNRNPILADLLNRIERFERLAAGEGAAPVLAEARLVCSTLGKRVRIQIGVREVEGLALDLDPMGRLLLREDSGAEFPVELGEVTRSRRID